MTRMLDRIRSIRLTPFGSVMTTIMALAILFTWMGNSGVLYHLFPQGVTYTQDPQSRICFAEKRSGGMFTSVPCTHEVLILACANDSESACLVLERARQGAQSSPPSDTAIRYHAAPNDGPFLTWGEKVDIILNLPWGRMLPPLGPSNTLEENVEIILSYYRHGRPSAK